MRSAASVRYPASRSRFQARFLLALGFLGLLAWFGTVVWLPPLGSAVYAATWLLWVVWVQRGWSRSPSGHLVWLPPRSAQEKGAWRWYSVAYHQGVEVVRLRVVLDFQQALWLDLVNADGARLWLWLDRDSASMHWHRLRCAVMASHLP